MNWLISQVSHWMLLKTILLENVTGNIVFKRKLLKFKLLFIEQLYKAITQSRFFVNINTAVHAECMLNMLFYLIPFKTTPVKQSFSKMVISRSPTGLKLCVEFDTSV